MKRLLFCTAILIFYNVTAQTALVTKSQDAQQYIIIDRKLKVPIQLADSFTMTDAKKGLFPIERSKVDSIIGKLTEIRDRLLKNAREHYDEFTWKIGNTEFKGKVVKWYYGDRFNIALSTNVGNGYTPSFYIVNSHNMNKESAAYLKKLIAYIQKGK